MNGKNSNPPELAIWWLRHACPGKNDALTGDLIERFREGKIRGWFWKQVFNAFLVGVLGEIWRHWPEFVYAISGTVLTWSFWDAAAHTVPNWLNWSDLPWPWSQMASELSPSALLALAALSILIAGLVIQRSFRWVSLLQTGVISLALITVGHYSIDLFPWLLHAVPGDQNHESLIIPLAVQMLCSFFTFLVAAWLGCLSVSRRRLVQ